MIPFKVRSFARDTRGFSLMEMAFVMAIIGLLLLAVMKGRDLLERARLQSTWSMIQGFQTAVTTFQTTFQSLPGDMASITEIDTTLRGGNDNGIIEGSGLNAQDEAGQFWQHLRALGIISGVAPLKNTQRTLSEGQGLPKLPIGGGVSIAYNVFHEGRHWFVLGRSVGGAWEASLSPSQVASWDRRYDTGLATTGAIRAQGDRCHQQGRYLLSEKGKTCKVYIELAL